MNGEEKQRLEALHCLRVLDTAPEPVFNRVTEMVANLFDIRIACITLVDENRFFFKAAHGIQAVEANREPGFCDNTVADRKLRVISDAAIHPETKNHGLVRSAPHIRFYAGAPLITADGHAIGTLCVMDMATRSFSDQDGQVLQELADYVMFQLDLRRVRQEAEEEDKKAQQRQKLESLGMLAGGIAHDFNNYLMGILGNASIANSLLPGNSSVRRIVNDIIDAANGASELAEQLLTYAGQRTPTNTLFCVTDLLHETCKLARSSIAENVCLELNAEESIELAADKIQLRQMVINLIINAAQAIGSKPGRVVVSLESRDAAEQTREAIITVADDGCGMSRETQASLFDPFFSTKVSGRGLGLAIVHRIVQEHGGEITVDSEPGKGTTFTVVLPAMASAVNSWPVDSSHHEDEISDRRNLLAIDDESVVLRFLMAAAEQLGHKVMSAEGGREALDMIHELLPDDRPDTILLDASLPGLSSGELLRALRKQLPSVEVIIMSGHDLTSVRERFEEFDNLQFLQKPFTIDKLNGVLESDSVTSARHARIFSERQRSVSER